MEKRPLPKKKVEKFLKPKILFKISLTLFFFISLHLPETSLRLSPITSNSYEIVFNLIQDYFRRFLV